jgi:predicted GTPase
MGQPRRIVIMGAAGRDFHDFNTLYRSDADVTVVAFTATQIPGIDGRVYPPSLAGRRHPSGIPIRAEDELEEICREAEVTDVVFAYSDVPYAVVMSAAARAQSVGANFVLPSARSTMLAAKVPVIAVTAVRTGCGKSQVSRWIADRLAARGLRAAAVRHPMPYGDLEKQAVQRFSDEADLVAADCTLEEREEYEPYIARGLTVYAGVDYGAILDLAQTESDVILWDGGNNDTPFFAPDFHIVLTDALRPGHETTYYPGEVNLRMADVVVVAKSDVARDENIASVREVVSRIRPDAPIYRGGSPVTLADAAAVRGKRVLVVDDGPTLTHGGMAYGAGYVAAQAAGAAEIVDPRAGAAPALRAVFEAFPHLERVLPAMGYGEAQRADLAQTINASGADVVVAGTPIDLAQALDLEVPVVRAHYDYVDLDTPGLGDALNAFLAERGLG